MRVVVSGLSVLLVVQGLGLLEALCLGIVGISSERDESRRKSGSVSGRHFMWRIGCVRATLPPTMLFADSTLPHKGYTIFYA